MWRKVSRASALPLRLRTKLLLTQQSSVQLYHSCPDLPAGLPCALNDPQLTDCRTPDCYSCTKVNGEDFWILYESVYQVNCLDYGKALRKENGEIYKWAVICGPVTTGGQEQLNYALGEYACQAFRQGAGYSEYDGGKGSSLVPCHFIQLSECGCAPEDVHTFGLNPPNKSCDTGEDCRFLCEDAGLEQAQQLCKNFGIEFWEGANVLQHDYFSDSTIGNGGRGAGELEIYIKGM